MSDLEWKASENGAYIIFEEFPDIPKTKFGE